MQQKNKKNLFFAKTLGKIIKEYRSKKCSINQIANEYDLDVGNTSRIENGLIDARLITLWKISEALNIKPSEIIIKLETKLGDNFHFFDE